MGERFRFPDWYLASEIGAGRLEEKGLYDEAERVRHQAKQALAMYMGAGVSGFERKSNFG